jgi:hypothetical protein
MESDVPKRSILGRVPLSLLTLVTPSVTLDCRANRSEERTMKLGYDNEKVKRNIEIAKEGFRTKILRQPPPPPPPRAPDVKIDVEINR